MDFTKTHLEYTESLVVKEVQDNVLKVTEALYRTTNLFSDTEPLKWSLRDSAVKILNAISSFDQNATYEQFRDLELLEPLIKNLFLKFDLAASGTFIARRNFDVLRQEYLSLRDMIAKNNNNANRYYLDGFSNHPNDKILSDTLEDKGQYGLMPKDCPIATQSEINIGTSASEKKIVERADNALKIHNSALADSFDRDISKISIESTKSPIMHNSIARTTEKSPEATKTSERQESLINLIKSKGSSSVGELTRLLGSAISEKTVQRELNKMAESGLLKREGEKRWRKYFV